MNENKVISVDRPESTVSSDLRHREKTKCRLRGKMGERKKGGKEEEGESVLRRNWSL